MSSFSTGCVAAVAFPAVLCGEVGQLVERLKLLINSAREFEWIGCLKRVIEGYELFGISHSGLHDSVKGGRRRVIDSPFHHVFSCPQATIHLKGTDSQ